MQVDPWIWVAFVAFIVGMLAVDLLVFHKEAHAVSTREAAIWSVVWVTLGLSFGVVRLAVAGADAGGEYLAGYLIEKSLSVDNIFVFALHVRVLRGARRATSTGCCSGACSGRWCCAAMFIAAGATLLEQFHWTIYVFGAFLVFTGIRMALQRRRRGRPGREPGPPALPPGRPGAGLPRAAVLRPREIGRRLATPLLAVLVRGGDHRRRLRGRLDPGDLRRDHGPVLVFTSNVFAILGLRAMYFLLAGMIGALRLSEGRPAAVLVFVGTKMLVADLYHVPIWASLAVIAGCIGASIGFSLKRTAEPEPAALEPKRSPEPADHLG